MGLGDSWGTREELLHPRDKNGRFRSKWKMAAGVVDAITNILAKFNPRTFSSDQQAAQYVFNRKPRGGGGLDMPRFAADYPAANQALRRGDMDASTKKFVQMMDRNKVTLPDDIIVSRRVTPEAFGLTPETMGLDEGGIEDFTGKLIGDRGYGSTNIGTPLGQNTGILMTVAVPKGTQAIIPGDGPGDREVILDRDQEYRITKVTPDGAGGYYVMAVATDRTPGETPEPIGRPAPGAGPGVEQREAGVAQVTQSQQNQMRIQSDTQVEAEAAQREQARQQAMPQGAGQQQVPAPPGTPPPRTEPVVSRAVGGPAPGSAPAPAIGQETVPTPEPEPPTPRIVDIRNAVREANIPAPSAGSRRKEFNDAYEGIATGKKDPRDSVRELERDIAVNQRKLQAGQGDEELADDIRAQEQLRDLIREQYNLPAPVEEKKPARRSPGIRPTPEERRQDRGNAKKAAATRPTDAQQQKVDREQEQSREVAAETGRAAAKRTNARVAESNEEADTANREVYLPLLEAAGIKEGDLSQFELTGLNVVMDMVRRKRISRAEGARRLRNDRGEDDHLNRVADQLTKPAPRKAAAKKAAPVKKASPAKAAPESGDDLDKMTKAELYAEAKKRGLAAERGGIPLSRMTKDQLKKELRGLKDLPAEPGSTTNKEQQITELFGGKRPTVADLRAFAKENDIAPATSINKMRRDGLINTILEEMSTRGRRTEGAKPRVPEAPPVKKAAKVAVPGAAPGTAAGKITAGRLQPGMRVRLTPENKPTNRRTGGKIVTITSVDRDTNGRIRISGTDEQGNPVENINQSARGVAGLSPSQTLVVVPDLGEQSVTKRSSGLPLKPETADFDALVERLTGVRGADRAERQQKISDMIADLNAGELAKLASRYSGGGEVQLKLPKGLSIDDRRDWFAKNLAYRQDSGAGHRRPSPERKKLEREFAELQDAEDLAGDLEQSARDRQSAIDSARKLSTAAGELDEILHNGASDRAVLSRLRAAAERGADRDIVVENRVRAAYVAVLARNGRKARPGDTQLVALADLREELGESTNRHEIDAAILRLHAKDRGTSVVPENKQAALTQADRDAAISIGNQDRHNIAIDDPSPRPTGGLDLGPVISAIESGDRDKARAEMAKLLDLEGITPYGKAGDRAKFDPKQHEAIGKVRQGADVQIVRPGLTLQRDGEDIRLSKSVVEAAEEPPAGDFESRTVTPIDNAPRKNEFKQAWDDADIKMRDGSPKRATNEIIDDISSGKITPQEGIQRMESEISFNKEELADIDSTLRGELDTADRQSLVIKAAKLEGAIKAQQRASEFLRDYFKNEEVTLPEIEKTVGPDIKKILEVTTPEQLKEAAVRAGFPEPEGNTKGEVLSSFIKKVAQQELDRRASQMATKAAKKTAAKKAAPPPPPKVDASGEGLNIRAISEGLDLDESQQWTKNLLDEAQRALDGERVTVKLTGAPVSDLPKNPTPAAVGRWLEGRAEAYRGMGAIRYGEYNRQDSSGRDRDPEFLERNARAKQAIYAEADRMQALADRLKKTRRPAKKAAPAKAAPPAQQRVETELAKIKQRMMDETMERLQGAKNRRQAEDAMAGLLMPELRVLAAQHGVSGRRKADIISQIADRYTPAAAPAKTPVARPSGLSPSAVQVESKSLPEGHTMWLRDSSSPSPSYRIYDADGKMVALVNATNVEVEEGRTSRTMGETERHWVAGVPGRPDVRGLQLADLDDAVADAFNQAKKAAATPMRAKVRQAAPVKKFSGEKSNKPLIENTWGGRPGEVHFHQDGEIGQLLRQLGDDVRLDADGEPLGNVIGKIATDAVMGRISMDGMIRLLRQLQERLPDAAAKKLERALDNISSPERDVPRLPEGTPEPLRRLVVDLANNPLARGGSRAGQHGPDKSELDMAVDFVNDFASGQVGGPGLREDLRRRLYNKRHESMEGKMEIDRIVQKAITALDEIWNDKNRRGQLMRRKQQ